MIIPDLCQEFVKVFKNCPSSNQFLYIMFIKLIYEIMYVTFYCGLSVHHCREIPHDLFVVLRAAQPSLSIEDGQVAGVHVAQCHTLQVPIWSLSACIVANS